MSNVIYMLLGIAIFVAGEYHEVIKDFISALLQACITRTEKRTEKRQEKYAYCDETVYHMSEYEGDAYDYECKANIQKYEENAMRTAYDELINDYTINTYTDVEQAPPTPPQTEETLLHDYTPSLYEDVDVEIMTPERERDLYTRAKLGGV